MSFHQIAIDMEEASARARLVNYLVEQKVIEGAYLVPSEESDDAMLQHDRKRQKYTLMDECGGIWDVRPHAEHDDESNRVDYSVMVSRDGDCASKHGNWKHLVNFLRKFATHPNYRTECVREWRNQTDHFFKKL